MTSQALGVRDVEALSRLGGTAIERAGRAAGRGDLPEAERWLAVFSDLLTAAVELVTTLGADEQLSSRAAATGSLLAGARRSRSR